MTTAVRPGRYDPDNPYAAIETLPPRHAALVGATGALRPARDREFPLETILVILGGLCLPAGIIAIIVGWYGAAHTPRLYEQNDYLISGGLLGLGLVFVGGFLYFGYWMTRQIHAAAAANQQTLRALSRIEAQMASVAASSAATAAGVDSSLNGRGGRGSRTAGTPAVRRETPGGGVPGGLVATERGSLAHRPDCPVVANKQNLRPVDADARGFRPCQICAPLDE
jgi:hypothetical protein